MRGLSRTRIPDRAPSSVSHASIYLIEGELTEEQRTRVSNELLADPLTQTVDEGAAEVASDAVLVEVHPLPGVTDPAADSVQLAIKAMFDLDVLGSDGKPFRSARLSTPPPPVNSWNGPVRIRSSMRFIWSRSSLPNSPAEKPAPFRFVRFHSGVRMETRWRGSPENRISFSTEPK